MVLDRLGHDLGLSFKKYRGVSEFALSETSIDQKRVIFLKPLDFMNRSGKAVSHIASFYKVDNRDILIVHDDLDIELGRMKFVRSGGAGGHNGVHSIIEALGTNEFPRLKIGISRPEPFMPADRYVLAGFSAEQLPVLEKVIEAAARALLNFIESGIDMAMNRFNGRDVADILKG